MLMASATVATAEVTWPPDQLLPSFSTPAATQDLITLSRDDEGVLFASLKGVVNATSPRIFSYEGGDEGKYTWLQSLGLAWSEPADKWTLITTYRGDIAGLVVYDDAQLDTLNLATTIAGPRKALVASPALLPRLTAEPYNLPILVDLRGQFSSKLAVYQSLFDNQWPGVTHRLLIGLDPAAHKAGIREYAVALGTAVVWLDPRVAAEKTLLDSFLSSMGAGTMYLGWWPEEQSGVSEASTYGVSTAASDWSANLTVYGGTSRVVNVKPIPAKPALQNKIYVGFIMADGDNIQFVEHYQRKLWDNPGRGQVPMGWTMSPLMLDAMPGILDYYYSTATGNDALLAGPSGYGYTYPNNWTNPAALDQFVATTEDYSKRAGFRIVTVWNTINGGINTNVGNSFATNAPSLLGLTSQNTNAGLKIYQGELPALALACNYCWDEQSMKNAISSASKGWNKRSPRFILIQAQPWQGVTPTSFLNVKNSLNANYVVVRPDTLFQLLREANGLPIEPLP
jgi:GxGYxYP putative glycoside hydrolase C-terminal domain/GxGYxYP third domain/GxGYxYP_N second domain